mmetsp:Transcript_33167/g.65669  ORF Transcript_33167/g.65669 Transcript_33167/m.65669 type:complete len:657 (-) Transcript_33167:67-2037(-)
MPVNTFTEVVGDTPSKSEECCFSPPLAFLRSIFFRRPKPTRGKSFFENIVRERSGWSSEFDKYYEVERVIGEGSMGSVFVVKRRQETIGGSARAHGEFLGRSSMSIRSGGTLSGFSISPESSLHGLSSLHGGRTVGSSIDGSGHGRSRSLSLDSKSGCNTPLAPSSPVRTPNGSPRRISDIDDEPYRYALKTIQLNRVSEAFLKELRNEVEILKSLDHPNIVRPVEVFESARNRRLFVVMKLCSGGDLYSRDPYTETAAANIVGKIMCALRYMHSRNIMHRDIKYENIMFEHQGPDAEVKLIDFGLSAKYMPSDPHVSGTIGTIYTMSPEVLGKRYTSKADLWSMGVVAYMLLSSRLPFYGNDRRKIISRIKKCKYNFNDMAWRTVSDHAKTFVRSLLQADPDLRPTASGAMQHKWIRTHYRLSKRYPGDHIMEQMPDAIQNFTGLPNIKKMALMLVAHNSTTAEIGDLQQVFDQYDSNNEGYITRAEFKEAMSKFGDRYSEEDINKMFSGLDFDESGKICYTEFLAATIETCGYIEEERLAEAFDRLDCDGSGYISKKNLREILGKNYTEKKVNHLIAEADFRQDGRISYDEFLMLFREDVRHTGKESMRMCVSYTDLLNTDLLNINSIEETSSGSEDSNDSTGRTMFSHLKRDF